MARMSCGGETNHSSDPRSAVFRRRSFAVLVGFALTAPLLLVAPAAASAPGPAKPYDFNGDGFPELATSADYVTVGGHSGAGAVYLLSGSKTGLSLKPQVVTETSGGLIDPSDRGELFGFALASGDFDRDGFADLAVGQVGVDTGDASDTGKVTILYGSTRGLDLTRATVLARPGLPFQFADFGWGLAAADLDGDGYADLAVGAPGDGGPDPSDQNTTLGGTVTLFFGGRDGLDMTHTRLLRGERTGPEQDRDFGAQLAAGDVDDDGTVDLVVGSRGAGFLEGEGEPGSVSYCPSGSDGPTGCVQLVHGDEYAGLSTVRVGNVNGSLRPEIVVGVPAAVEESKDPGKVVVLSTDGPSPARVSKKLTITQASKGVPGSDEPYDAFGSSVAVGDVDRDGYDDLVVGVEREDDGKKQNTGRVTLVYGAEAGYRTSGNKLYSQDTKGIPSVAKSGEVFGAAVTLVDHDADGHLDLAIGAPADGAGAVTTLTGKGTSFTTKGSKTFRLNTLGQTPEPDLSAPGYGAVLGQ